MTNDVRHGLGVLALAAGLGLLWLGLRTGGEDFAQVAEASAVAAVVLGLVALFLVARSLMGTDNHG